MQSAELLEQGQLLRRQDRASAIHYFEKWLNIADERTDRLALATASMELALELIEISQPEGLLRANSLLQKAEDLLKNYPSNCDRQKAYLHYCQGIWALKQNNLADGISLLQAAYQTYEQINDLEGLALTDDALGKYYATIGDFQTALFHLERSLSLRQELDDEHAKAISFGHLGRIHLQIEELDPVEDLFQTSLEIGLAYEDEVLRIQALSGLAQLAIARSQWQLAIAMIQEALDLTQEPLDTKRVAYLSLDFAEALLGDDRLEDSLKSIDLEVMPRFVKLQDKVGIAVAKRMRGRILYRRLLDGLDTLEEDTIEIAEDTLLDASMLFEQAKMPQEYAKTLYDLAFLYQLCLNSRFKYQYQGKSVRSLELALNVLEQYNQGNTRLASQMEAMLMHAMGGAL
ncbi:hypothetical protein V2H45_16175 [Tumidithrix elongata RA019]|uniref:MalT-like TPR region domain-containing protein n=1 Tax=Tumidithrix elongata BACA0141 TaxID=2716417 RepID=A0AAW9PZ32_9CYAN|nr:hypothetical protein [Tumidithrix elongata RA019]